MDSIELKKEKKSLYAASKNKDVVNEILQKELKESIEIFNDQTFRILEIASGTGEHCERFVSSIISNFPSLKLWYQPTENDIEMIPHIPVWNNDFMLPFKDIVQYPLSFNVHEGINDLLSKIPKSNSLPSLENNIDCMICINMIHYTAFENIPYLFEVSSKLLSNNGFLLTYGPYCVDNQMTEGNIRFDAILKNLDPNFGIRGLEVLEDLANKNGLMIAKIYLMPSNNLILIFKHVSSIDSKFVDSPLIVRAIDYYGLLPNSEEFNRLKSLPYDQISSKLGEVLLNCRSSVIST